MIQKLIYKINIAPDGIPTTVRLSQNENGRVLQFSLAGERITIPEGAVATISGTKPDGHVYSAEGALSGLVAAFNEDVQMTAAAGEWAAKLRITYNGATIATQRLWMVIDADTVDPGSVPSESELNGLVAEAQQYAEAARSAAYGSPLTAATAADMINTARVYVYTGNETGMLFGHWYYYSDGAWNDGGVYQSQGVQTDTTLTIAGMPADAKATGDALAAKVDSVSGKGLSTEDYTTAEKEKLSGIENQATRVLVDATLANTGQAADAKKVGDELTDLMEDLSLSALYNNLWAYGNISKGYKQTTVPDQFTPDSLYDTTDFIPVAGVKYLIGKGLRYWFYDSNKSAITNATGILNQQPETYSGSEWHVLAIRRNAAYIKVTQNASAEKALYFTTPYDDSLKEDLTLAALYNNLWTYGTISEGYALTGNTGELTANDDYDTTDFIPVSNVKMIVGDGARYWFYDDDKNSISSATGLLYQQPETFLNSGQHYIFVPSTGKYFRICARKENTKSLYASTCIDDFLYHLATNTPSPEITLYCIGDSITRGMYTVIGDTSSRGPTDKGYPYWIGQINNYNVVNLGESGGGYALKGTQSNSNGKDIVDNNTFANADIITIAFGVNDYKTTNQSILLGNMNSTPGDGTVIGNMRYMIETLADPTNGKAKQAQIIIMLPMNENRFSGGTLATNWAFGYAFRENKTLTDYRNAIRECAEYYNLKVIDEEEVTPLNRLNIRQLLGDGLHPTLAFYKQMGQALAPLIH